MSRDKQAVGEDNNRKTTSLEDACCGAAQQAETQMPIEMQIKQLRDALIQNGNQLNVAYQLIDELERKLMAHQHGSNNLVMLPMQFSNHRQSQPLQRRY